MSPGLADRTAADNTGLDVRIGDVDCGMTLVHDRAVVRRQIVVPTGASKQ